MFCFPLFKMTLKKNWVLWLIFFGVLTMYMTVMMTMFNPEDMEKIMAMLDLFPKEMMNAFGFSHVVTDYTSYLASWLYGMLMVAFPLVYAVILSNRLLAKMADNHSLAYLLATPNSRMSIAVTQGFYAVFSVAVLFAALTLLGIGVSALMFPGELNVYQFIRLNITTMLVNISVVTITFFFSAFFNESRNALGFGTAVPLSFFLLKMLGGITEKSAVLKEISIYGFYDPVELVRGAGTIGVNIIYILLAVVLFTASAVIFSRKRLPL